MANPELLWSYDLGITWNSITIPYELLGVCGGFDFVGRLWVFGFNNTNQLVFITSNDLGLTWVDPQVIIPVDISTRIAIDCLVNSVLLGVAVFYVAGDHVTKMFAQSLDLGLTWTTHTM